MQKKNQQKTHQRNPHQHKNEQHDAYRRWKTWKNMLARWAAPPAVIPKMIHKHPAVIPEMIHKHGALVPASLVHENRVTGEITNYNFDKLMHYNGNYCLQFTGPDGNAVELPCTLRIA